MIKIKIASKTAVAKNVVSLVVAGGVAKVVSGVIANNTDPETTPQAIEIGAASIVLGAVLADHCRRYTDTCIDQIVAAFKGTATPDAPVVTIIKG
jgi:hypothetical protein